MQSITLNLVFDSLPELADFVRAMPNLQLSGPAKAAPVGLLSSEPAPAAALPAPVQHHAPAVQHHAPAPAPVAAPVQTLQPAPAPVANGHAAPAGADIPTIKSLLAAKIRDANADAAQRGARLQNLRGLMGRYDVAGVDQLAPHQLDAFHFELGNL